MIAYPAKFAPENDAINVTFPDLPEAITCGYSEPEAMEYAVDALETILSEYIKRRREIPNPRKAKGKGMRLVVLPALAEAKVQLYEAMRSQGVRKADLARRIGWHKSQMDRLLDLTHASRLDQIEAALKGLHMRLAVHVENCAA
jgi:antitoxin HicB